MSVVSELIVLSYTKYGENSIVLHTLSREWGRRSFLVKVGKKVSMALFLPLNILEASVATNGKSDLWWAGKLRTVTPLSSIRGNIAKNSMTMFLSEVLYRTIREGICDEKMFSWCKEEILSLEGMGASCANFHIKFLLDLCGELGFLPSFENIEPFIRRDSPRVREILENPLESAMAVELDGQRRNEIAEDILKYLEYHTESRINVRSLAVLRELFS